MYVVFVVRAHKHLQVCLLARFSFPFALELCSSAFREVVITPPHLIVDVDKCNRKVCGFVIWM